MKIGSRAIALLGALIERPGGTVSYDQLMAAGWAGPHVDPANLRVQMSALRRLLDNGGAVSSHVTNAPGRGYALTVLSITLQPPRRRPPGNAPVGLLSPMTTIVGRGMRNRDIEGAREQFGDALDTAFRQGAQDWELRAARSLAELDARSGRSTAARQRLSAVLRRVREGGAKTADVRIAHELLYGLA